VLRAVLEQIARLAVAPGTPVSLDVPPDLAAVADRLVLDRVVSNLLSNATRYGEPPFCVSAEQRDHHLRITVSDEGAGVPEEMRSRLFERFARGAETNGSGLGLAIARSYARAHGGDIVYDPGDQGARFELILPQG
jgi:signal transduction histidine kinase